MTNKSVRPLHQPAQILRVFIQSKPLLKVGRLIIFHVNVCTNLRATSEAVQASLCRWTGDCSVIYGSSPAHYSQGLHNSFISVSKHIWLDRIIIHIITRTHTWTSAFGMDIGFEIPGHHSVHSLALQSQHPMATTFPFTHPVLEHWFLVAVPHHLILEMLHLFEMSNGKRKRLDIMELSYPIICNEFNILFHLWGKLYFCLLLCIPLHKKQTDTVNAASVTYFSPPEQSVSVFSYPHLHTALCGGSDSLIPHFHVYKANSGYGYS